ncbi:ABC transporter permease [Kribbella italica]|uniref:ABC-2 type transport system permease protein n=1 Tax=Kribbella italica TaxID=1540520 RepID=A0A7W9J1D2_9ACTN|nr:ABC-2 family transporter protein [Kribbella italica]MBB5833839.1 ABC-2 type transport system permease protein [Kribbella italica]
MLFGVLFSLSVRRAVAFRADLLFELLVTIVGAGASVAALLVVYTRTETLGGWGPGEAIALLGTFQVVSGLRSTFVEPNLQFFGEQVKSGRLDAILVQPAPSILLASLGSCAPTALIQVGLGVGIAVTGVVKADLVASPGGVVAWLVVVAAATVTMWATRVMVASVVFWAFGLSLDVLYDALWQFGRYPVQVYQSGLQVVFTYVVPVSLIATVPVEALRGEALVVVPLIVAVGTSTAAWVVWRRGLRRYTSATS